MNRIIDRITGLGVNPEEAAFTVSSGELFKAVSEVVDFETLTDHELKEIGCIVIKALKLINWKSVVNHSVNHLPFGLNQTGIAWDGNDPCEGCPDAMLFDENCHHQGECKAWEIYEARF